MSRNRSRALLVVCVAIVASWGAPAAAATATTEPPASTHGEQIVFTRAGGSYGEATLFVANSDGSDERMLLEYGEIECCASASADGSRVAFAVYTDEHIHPGLVGVDGSGYTVLDLPPNELNLGSGPFSPDGTLIAFEGFHFDDPTANGIYIGSSTDASGLRRLTQQQDIPGSFSPDGSQLAFHRPAPNSDASPMRGTLVIVNVDGTAEHQVTPDGTEISCCPRWSPDGTRIAFVDPGGSLWLIDPDGANLTELFAGGGSNGYAISPTWSPDGSQIMFALDSGPDPLEHPANEIVVVNADGSGTPLTVLAGDDFKRDLNWVSTT